MLPCLTTLLLFSCCGAAAPGGGEKKEVRSDTDLCVGVVHNGWAYAADTALSLVRGDLLATGVPYQRLEPAGIEPEPSVDFPPRWKFGCNEFMMVNASPHDGLLKGNHLRHLYTIGMPTATIDKRLMLIQRDRKPNPNDDTVQFGETIEFNGFRGDDLWFDTNDHLLNGIYRSMRSYVHDHKTNDADRTFSDYEFFYDLVPVKASDGPLKPGACDFFVLASESLQLEIEKQRTNSVRKPLETEGEAQPATRASGGEWEKVKNPLKPMLGVWHKSDRGQWALVEQIKNPCFNERFHIFVQGTAYFFVTDSGKIYLSKKPEKGERTLEEVWKKPGQPIVGAITDTASGKTFLFGRKGKADAKDAKMFYFELSEKPELVDFTADVLVHKKMPEPLETVMSYAYLLIADKKIKIEPKPEPKPDPKP